MFLIVASAVLQSLRMKQNDGKCPECACCCRAWCFCCWSIPMLWIIALLIASCIISALVPFWILLGVFTAMMLGSPIVGNFIIAMLLLIPLVIALVFFLVNGACFFYRHFKGGDGSTKSHELTCTSIHPRFPLILVSHPCFLSPTPLLAQ